MEPFGPAASCADLLLLPLGGEAARIPRCVDHHPYRPKLGGRAADILQRAVASDVVGWGEVRCVDNGDALSPIYGKQTFQGRLASVHRSLSFQLHPNVSRLPGLDRRTYDVAMVFSLENGGYGQEGRQGVLPPLQVNLMVLLLACSSCSALRVPFSWQALRVDLLPLLVKLNSGG